MPCAPRMSRLKISAIGPVIGSLSPNATSRSRLELRGDVELLGV